MNWQKLTFVLTRAAPALVVVLLLASAGPRNARADDWSSVDVRVSNGVKVVLASSGGHEYVLGAVETIPAHRPLYHWAAMKDIRRWITQGRVETGELDFLKKGTGLAGGGFYASLDSLNSNSFGPWVAVIDPPVDLTVLKASTRGLAAKMNWNQVIAQLAQKGVDGVMGYEGSPSNWVNLIQPRALESIRRPSPDEIIKNPLFKSVNESPRIDMLLQLNSELGMNPADLTKLDPALAKVAQGSVDEKSVLALWPHFAMIKSALPDDDSPLLKKFTSEATEILRSKFGQAEEPWEGFSLPPSPKTQEGGDPAAQWSDVATGLRIQPSQFMPESGLSPIDFAVSPKLGSTLTNGFARDLAETFEFIDAQDILVSAARGDATPWTRYDEAGKPPLLNRWEQASALNQDPLLGEDRSQDRLVKIHHTLEAGSATSSGDGFRSRPVVAGGDIDVGGKGYYRINAHQKQVLVNNPFLSTEIIDDPAGGGFLARHEYPSAGVFRRFKSFLSKGLAAKLVAADAAHQLTPGTPQFGQYTQEIIEELTAKAYQIQDPVTQYLALMSIHPFEDFNGRSLRMLYKTRTGNPLYVWNFDLDLLMTPAEFRWEIAAGNSALTRLENALIAESSQRAEFPKFYDLPELWMMGARTGSPKTDPGSYVSRMKQFYGEPSVVDRINHKQFQEVYADLSRCDSQLARDLGH